MERCPRDTKIIRLINVHHSGHKSPLTILILRHSTPLVLFLCIQFIIKSLSTMYTILWDLMPCSLVDDAIFPRNLLSSFARWNTEAEGYPGNVDAHLPKYTKSHPRRSIISSHLFLDLKRSLRFTFSY